MLNKFAIKFRKVSEEPLGRDEMPHQTYDKLFFLKHLSHLLWMLLKLVTGNGERGTGNGNLRTSVQRKPT